MPGKVLVKRHDAAHTSAGGLFLPAATVAKELPQRCTVVRVADDVDEVAVGQDCLIGKWDGDEVWLGEQGAEVEHLVIDVEDVLGVWDA